MTNNSHVLSWIEEMKELVKSLVPTYVIDKGATSKVSATV